MAWLSHLANVTPITRSGAIERIDNARFTEFLPMTAQAAEKLIYQGETLDLCSEPLAHFPGMPDQPWVERISCTVLLRGYIGTWAIEADRLYLQHLQKSSGEEDESVNVGIEHYFPGYPDGVFAHWYTGELRCCLGERLIYRHGGLGGGTYEQDLFLRIERGVFQGDRLVRNGYPARPSLPNSLEAGLISVEEYEANAR